MQRNETGGNSSALDRAKAAWGAQSALIQGHKAEVMERNNYIRTGITNRHFRAFRQFCLEEDQYIVAVRHREIGDGSRFSRGYWPRKNKRQEVKILVGHSTQLSGCQFDNAGVV